MALYNLNPIFVSVRGSIGDLIFTSYRGKPVIRRKSTKKRQFNAAQRVSQGHFARAVALWKSLSKAEKSSWQEIALSRNIFAYNAFISINVRRANDGLPMIRDYSEINKPVQSKSDSYSFNNFISGISDIFDISQSKSSHSLPGRYALCNSPP